MAIIDEKTQETPRNVPPAPHVDPWLVFCPGRRGQNQTFFSLSENRYHVKNIPDMRRKYICTCSHGWLVLLDSEASDNCFLLNPISMEKIQLPQWKRNFTYEFCVLSSSPKDSNCTVLFTRTSKDGYLPIMLYQLGKDGDWCEQKLRVKYDYINNLTWCAGKIYVLVDHGRLKSIDINSTPMVIKKVRGAKVPKPSKSGVNRYSLKLVESRGELFSVRMIYFPDEDDVRGLEVFKLDFKSNIWARVNNLGDRALFIGPRYNVSCSTVKGGAKGNTVYFTLPKDRSLYAFRLDDEETIDITLPCPNVVSHWSHPEWFLPLAMD